MDAEFKAMSFDELLEVFDDIVAEMHRKARKALAESEFDAFRRGCLADIDKARSDDNQWLGSSANTLAELANKIGGRDECEACGAIAKCEDGLCEECLREDVA